MQWLRFIQGVNEFGLAVHRAIWSKTRPDLEVAIKELSKRSQAYKDQFVSKARLDAESMAWWREDQKWKEWHNPNYDEDLKKSQEWSEKCQNLLFDLTVALNRFGDTVRHDLKPDFMVSYGRFGVSDSLGYTNQMEAVVYFPDKYSDEQ
nr:hypothetical protein HAGR004_03350 [Bdellovibrio sp. HAGR004]